MKTTPRIFVVAAALTVAMLPACFAQSATSATGSMTIWQARRSVVELLGSANVFASDSGLRCSSIPRESVLITNESVEFDIHGHSGASCTNQERVRHAVLDLKTAPVFRPHHHYGYCELRDGNDAEVKPVRVEDRQSRLTGNQEPVCEKLADVLNRLSEHARTSPAREQQFREQAAAYRALATKPALPEAAREQSLLAENAVREKQLEKALSHYEKAVQLAPTWPQGYFNGALIAAELHYYDEAISFMQNYLELEPDAPDAAASRDQIVIWKDKLHSAPAAPEK